MTDSSAPANTIDLSRIVRDAAELIRKRGLAKCSLVDGAGRICGNGALLMALGGADYETVTNDYQLDLWDALNSPEYSHAFADIACRTRIILESRGDIGADIPTYNNRSITTAEDVAALFDEVAKSYEPHAG